MEQVMRAAPDWPQLADLTERLSTQLGDETERCRSQSDAMRADVVQMSRPSRRAVEDAVAAGFRAGRGAALADEAERWSALAYALRHGGAVRDSDSPDDGWAAVVGEQAD
jgi:hypothetical protein